MLEDGPGETDIESYSNIGINKYEFNEVVLLMIGYSGSHYDNSKVFLVGTIIINEDIKFQMNILEEVQENPNGGSYYSKLLVDRIAYRKIVVLRDNRIILEDEPGKKDIERDSNSEINNYTSISDLNTVQLILVNNSNWNNRNNLRFKKKEDLEVIIHAFVGQVKNYYS